MINLIFRLDLDNGEYAGTGHFKRVEMIYKYLKKKHYLRKQGNKSYYGQ